MKNEKRGKVDKTVVGTSSDRFDCMGSGTRYVFNKIYSIMKGTGIKSPMIATPGQGFERYIKYVNMLGPKSCKKTVSVFMEIDKKRFKDMKRETDGHHGIRTYLFDAFHYVVKTKRYYRIQDFSIGTGLPTTLSHVTSMLRSQYEQFRCRRLWKAQVYSFNGRANSSNKIILAGLKSYVTNALGLEIESINGVDVDKDISGDCLSANDSLVVSDYAEKKRKNSAHVYQHNIVFKKNNKQAVMYMFSYLNGSQMWATLIMYK